MNAGVIGSSSTVVTDESPGTEVVEVLEVEVVDDVVVTDVVEVVVVARKVNDAERVFVFEKPLTVTSTTPVACDGTEHVIDVCDCTVIGHAVPPSVTLVIESKPVPAMTMV